MKYADCNRKPLPCPKIIQPAFRASELERIVRHSRPKYLRQEDKPNVKGSRGRSIKERPLITTLHGP
jgi:hypothetical protein